MMRAVRLVVFDMAGTTVQVGDLVPAALREALEPLTSTIDDGAIRAVRGRSKKDAIAALVAAAHLDTDTDGASAGLTADDVVRSRPAPDLITEAMRRTGVGDPSAVIAVGDTIADMEAARRAGVVARVAVLTGTHAREALEACSDAVVLPSIAQLPAWLEAGA